MRVPGRRCARSAPPFAARHPPGSGGGFYQKWGGVYQYSILMYPAVFRCILLKYCILAYSDVFQNVFSYLLVCDRDTLCFMYSTVFYMYSECILRRGRDTLIYIQNTSRYTYPHPHTWPDPNASRRGRRRRPGVGGDAVACQGPEGEEEGG